MNDGKHPPATIDIAPLPDDASTPLHPVRRRRRRRHLHRINPRNHPSPHGGLYRSTVHCVILGRLLESARTHQIVIPFLSPISRPHLAPIDTDVNNQYPTTMHQQPRHPPRVASPASSPQTNPARTNNPREAIAATSRARAGSEATSSDRARRSTEVDGGDGGSLGYSRESVKKLDQIIQVRRRCLTCAGSRLGGWLTCRAAEFLSQNSHPSSTITARPRPTRGEEARGEEAKQMGKTT